MLGELSHRGPDDQGTWSDLEAGIFLGQRRLSILDLSPLGHQPMLSRSGRYVLSYNGEVYNFRALRHRLEALGECFRGQSDTEVVLAAVECWGLEATLAELVGMFAIALWDRHERCLHLIRDRFGKKPLYYARSGAGWAFASELKALRRLPEIGTRLNRDALVAYMRLGCVPQEQCIYRNAFKVEPGAWICLRAGTTTSTRYWSAAQAALQAPPFSGDLVSGLDRLENLLEDAVRLRLESDVPLGAFLSGGIDSSLVVSAMQKLSTRPVKTFSIGFREGLFDEAPYAAQIARRLGTEHVELYVSPSEAREVIPLLPRMYDEPFGDSSQIPTYLVSRLARRTVTVALSGDGGDELFAGYPRYLAAWQGWSRLARIPARARRGAAFLLERLPERLWSRGWQLIHALLPHRLRQFKLYNKLPRLRRLLTCSSRRDLYLGLISQWTEPERLVLGGREAHHAYLQDPETLDYLDWMMLSDATVYLPDDILVKVDRASMAVGLEARCPLLDHRLFEFAWSLPRAWKHRRGQGKWILRQLLCRYLPEELFERPKMGFGVPIDAWLRGPLRDWADDLLSPAMLKRQGYLDEEQVTRTWQAHRQGRSNEHLRLWNVLMFQSWLTSQS